MSSITKEEAQLLEFLKKNGLEPYFDTFKREHIDLITLPDLNDDQLKELGVSVGHRIKLKKLFSDGQSTQEGDSSPQSLVQPTSQPTSSQSPTQPSSPDKSPSLTARNSSSKRTNTVSKTEPVQEKMREYVIKVIVVGEIGTGKTSLIQRYTSGEFDKGYKATIGVDFCLKELEFDKTKMVSLQLWDIAGQERFANLTRMYYKEARGAFIVFDLTRIKTFEAALKWKQDIDSKVTLPNGKVIPVVLLANKCDIPTAPDDWSKTLNLDKFCQENGFLKGFYTSAKEDIGITDAANFLVREILETDELKSSSLNYDKMPGLNVKGGKSPSENKSGPCCF